jgi:uncharacterized glyoxalase superfamily protein PhnB
MTSSNKAYFLDCKPIISVKDVSASLDYYCNMLGFTKVFSWKDGVGFCDYGKLDFAEVQRGGANIMMSLEENMDKGIRLYLDLKDSTELESLYQELEKNGASIIEPPNDKMHHMREMLVKDLDDNLLRIGAPLKS